MTLKSDPQRTREWQQRSRKRLATRAPMKGQGRIKPRRYSKTSEDGDPRRTIKDECDQIVRDIVALRDRTCVTCPETKGLHVGHLFRRGLERTRWDLFNNAGQCDPCNGKHEEDPEPYMEAFIQAHGADTYLELRKKSRDSRKFGYTELLEVRDGLRNALAKLRKRTTT